VTATDLHAIRDAIRDGIARTVAVIGLAGFALIHLLDLPDTISATPYIGWMYIALIISALGLAAVLTRSSDVRVWRAAAGLVTTVMVGYVLSRTTGLPQSTDDIGNWTQPLGIDMLFVGGSLLALSISVLRCRRPTAAPGRPASTRRIAEHDRSVLRAAA
jgi:Na+/proline symporter